MPPKKKIVATVTIQLDAGQANMGKAGQALGPHGVNIVEVVRTYNAATEKQRGDVVPAVITIYEDRTFSLVTKTPPTSALLRKAAGLDRGASAPNGTPVARLTREQVRDVARVKLPDLNTTDLDAAERVIAGTARSMGIAVD
ncbi:MAG TPA: 50S ribosomal protein L11 [Mycobacteriales bacterium]|nr:50S ribosomal protein L11 [Mycobacteriales bacterium]